MIKLYHFNKNKYMIIYSYSKGKEHTRVCKVKNYDVCNKKRYERY